MMKKCSPLAALILITLILVPGACGDSSTSSGDRDPAIVGRVLDGEGEPVEDARINLLYRVPDYFPWDFPGPGERSMSEDTLQFPQELVLRHNFPNPFNPATSISFALPLASHARLTLLDYLGIEVRVLLDGMQPAGNHEVIWDARDESGNLLPNGYYRARLDILGEEDLVLETRSVDGIFHASGPGYFHQTHLALTDAQGRFEILLEDLPIGEVFPMLSDSPVDTLAMITVGDTLRVYAQRSGVNADQVFEEIGLGDLDADVPVELILP